MAAKDGGNPLADVSCEAPVKVPESATRADPGGGGPRGGGGGPAESFVGGGGPGGNGGCDLAACITGCIADDDDAECPLDNKLDEEPICTKLVVSPSIADAT
jgi:hypothetical protein